MNNLRHIQEVSLLGMVRSSSQQLLYERKRSCPRQGYINQPGQFRSLAWRFMNISVAKMVNRKQSLGSFASQDNMHAVIQKLLSLLLNWSSFTAPVSFARRMLGFYDAWKVWWRRGHGTGTPKLVSSCKISSHFNLQKTITGIRKCISHAMRTTGVQRIAESHIILPGIQHEAITDLEETHVNSNSTPWEFCFCQNMGPQNVSVICAPYDLLYQMVDFGMQP